MATSSAPRGVFAPVATTLGDDGELALAAYRANLERYAVSPLDGVVLLGSNGESALLDEDEKLRLIEAGTAAVGGRRVVMAGTGAESTRGTIALTKRAAALDEIAAGRTADTTEGTTARHEFDGFAVLVPAAGVAAA